MKDKDSIQREFLCFWYIVVEGHRWCFALSVLSAIIHKFQSVINSVMIPQILVDGNLT